MSRRYVIRNRCAVLAGLMATASALAQTYPNRPLRIIAPFAPGGGSDLVARLMARELQPLLAQSVIVENRPGAGGVIGSEAAARAAPDGYTLLVVPISHAANVSLTAKLPYHPEKDFAPIVHIGSAPNVVLTHPSVPVRSVAELVKLAQARPGDLIYPKSKEFAERLAADGAEPAGGTPEAFAAFLRAEIVKWAAVVKNAKLAGP